MPVRVEALNHRHAPGSTLRRTTAANTLFILYCNLQWASVNLPAEGCYYGGIYSVITTVRLGLS
jgi:hypothetical protein